MGNAFRKINPNLVKIVAYEDKMYRVFVFERQKNLVSF